VAAKIGIAMKGMDSPYLDEVPTDKVKEEKVANAKFYQTHIDAAYKEYFKLLIPCTGLMGDDLIECQSNGVYQFYVILMSGKYLKRAGWSTQVINSMLDGERYFATAADYEEGHNLVSHPDVAKLSPPSLLDGKRGELLEDARKAKGSFTNYELWQQMITVSLLLEPAANADLFVPEGASSPTAVVAPAEAALTAVVTPKAAGSLDTAKVFKTKAEGCPTPAVAVACVKKQEVSDDRRRAFGNSFAVENESSSWTKYKFFKDLIQHAKAVNEVSGKNLISICFHDSNICRTPNGFLSCHRL